MPDEEITVGVPTDHGIEHVTVRGERTERNHDGTLHIYDMSGDEVAEFYRPAFIVRTAALP